MTKLVECVPNFSDGRRPEVVDAIAARVRGTPGVHLLDRTSDIDHNRSVLTFAGPADAVSAAMEAALAEAIERIDMNEHSGQHPRLGAVDVIPFVPLGDTTMEECVDLARSFGKRMAERFELPVYLYARAASRAERINLPDIRKPQYEGLRDVISSPEYEPDFGPARVHPTAGAIVVGARPFLIAYNINLETTDLDLAKRIGKQIRESSGGLARVQAMGLYMEDLQCAQVSMNLLDYTVTPLWKVWEAVRDAAETDNVELKESELIGLCPINALLDVADHIGVPRRVKTEERLTWAADWLSIRDFEPTMALELRLQAAGSEAT